MAAQTSMRGNAPRNGRGNRGGAPIGNRNALGNRGGTGRPSKYHVGIPHLAFRLAERGFTDAEIADAMGLSERTVNSWKHTQVEFSAALKRGKIRADGEAAHAPYQRAKGYSHEAVMIFNGANGPIYAPYTKHYPADARAAMFWLKNRQPAHWR